MAARSSRACSSLSQCATISSAARQPQRGPDRALPPGPSRSARPAVPGNRSRSPGLIPLGSAGGVADLGGLGRRWQVGQARRAACGPSTGSGSAAVQFQHAGLARGSSKLSATGGSGLSVDSEPCCVRQSAWYLARLAHRAAIEEPRNLSVGYWSQHAVLAGKAIELAIGQKLLDGLASGKLAIRPRTQLGGKCIAKACSYPLNGGGVSPALGLDLHLKEAAVRCESAFMVRSVVPSSRRTRNAISRACSERSVVSK